MSGDVQPRKRKEKKRKRADHEYHIQRIECLEDEDAGTPPPTLVGSSDHGDNVTIHVHKERGTGGHWCARIIFFILFSILVGLVGVIIFETRGSTDIDTPVASSRWAMIFEGWVDDSVSLHEEESHNKDNHKAVSHEEDEEHEEDQDDYHENEEESDQEGSEEGAAGSEEHGDGGEGGEEEEAEEELNEEEAGTEEEGDEAEEEEDNYDESHGVSEENDDVEPNDSGTLEEVDEEETGSNNVEVDGNEEDDVGESGEGTNELLNVSIEGVDPSLILNEEDDEEDMSYEFMGIPGVNEIDDDSDEPLEEIEDDLEIEEITNHDPADAGPEEEGKEEIEEESSVAVKFGVGVALVVAAHFVLIRRWSNVDAELAESNGVGPPDLSRRDTLISPPPPLIPKVQAEKPMQHGDPEPQITSIPKRKEVDIDTSESELNSGTEEDINYDEDSEDEEEEEEDIVEIDDAELVAKLEAKYGKIPTPSQSENDDDEGQDDEDLDEEEEEEEGEQSEEEEEEEEDSEKHDDWKHVKAPKAHSGSHPTENESKATGPKGMRTQEAKGATGGQQDIASNNVSDYDELLIQEELENWLMRDFDN